MTTPKLTLHRNVPVADLRNYFYGLDKDHGKAIIDAAIIIILETHPSGLTDEEIGSLIDDLGLLWMNDETFSTFCKLSLEKLSSAN